MKNWTQKDINKLRAEQRATVSFPHTVHDVMMDLGIQVLESELRNKKALKSRVKPKGEAVGHLIEQFEAPEPKKKKNSSIPRKEAPQLSQMKLWLKAAGIKFEEEYQFAKPRKFRADIFLPDLCCIIEYEGLNSEISGHTTFIGYTKNCQKYNIAALKGWIVLRYTAKNYGEMITDVHALKCQVLQ
jgi:hypothetical protein